MNKKYGKLLLIIIIVVQLAVPVTLLATKLATMKAVNEHGTDIKVSVQSIYFDSNCIYIQSDELGAVDYAHTYKYVTFKAEDNGYCYVERTNEKTSDGAYLKAGSYGNWSWYCIPYRNSGITEETLGVENVGYYNIYNAEIEKENILNGHIGGLPTEAYMIMRIYNGEFEIKEVYVGGVTLIEFLNKTMNGEIDPDRFEYCYEGYEYYEYYDERDEEVYDDKTEEITESVSSETM